MTVTAVGPRARLATEDPWENEPPRPPVAPSPSSKGLHRIDADILAFVANNQPKNDRVLYVGMNDESAGVEANGLRASGANVTTVAHEKGTTVRLDGRTFDLVEGTGCDAFAEALAAKHGLTPAVQKGIADALKGLVPPGARDELARIAMVFAPGENGTAIPSRLVLSGHSNGSDIHAGSEELKLHSIMALARAMPRAACQIEDVHFSGCFTSEQVTSGDAWKGVFPNLKSMWGYSEFAPSAPVGQIQAWERATRGRASGDPAHGLAGVATWSSRDGIREPGVTIQQLLVDVRYADERFPQHASGEFPVRSPHYGHAAADYATYRRLASRPELSSAQREAYRAKAEVMYRVRFYESSVRGEFAKEHGPSVSRAFAALGLAPPDFASLSRKDALVALDRFEARVKSRPQKSAEVAEALKVLDGLRRLDAQTIPQSWLH